MASAALAVLVVAGLPVAAIANGDAPVQSGVLDRGNNSTARGANGNILISSSKRRIYQANVESDTTFTVYDADTLKRLSGARFEPLLAAQTAAGSTDWVWSLDDAHDRLFTFEDAVADSSTGLPDYPMLVVDLKTLHVTKITGLWGAYTRLPLALSYDPPSDRIYVLTKILDVSGRTVVAVEERSTSGALIWEHIVDQCHGSMDDQYAPTVMRSLLRRNIIYVDCYNPRLIQAQVVRLFLGNDGKVARAEAIAAVPGALSTAFDRGSDRLFFLTTNSGAGRGAWVFDGLRSSFVGVIASGDARLGATGYSLGVDESNGRLYMQTPAGFMIADARRTPLPAGLLFRKYAGTGVGSIQVDTKRKRAFVPDPGTLNAVKQAQRYLVLDDPLPLSRDPHQGNPDSLTADVAEKAGVTDVNYSGAAQAYGFRALLTGGVQRTAWNIALANFDPSDPSSTLAQQVWGGISSVPLEQGGREIVAARLNTMSLTNSEADGEALPFDVDAGTVRDFEKNNQQWPFTPTECHDSGSGEGTRSGTGTSASCNARAKTVVASSGFDGVDAGGVSIRSAASWASIVKDPARGLVTRTTAAAFGVSILDRISIGTLSSESESWARGRKHTAGARYERTLADVRIDTNGDKKWDVVCRTVEDDARGPCALDQIESAFAEALGGLATVEFPEPDHAYFPDGSRGGFQAIVAKDRSRSYAERALNDDDSVEVPALQIVSYSDASAGRTRQIVQIAGVEAESHYGIFVIPGSEPGLPDPKPAPAQTLTPLPLPQVSAPAAAPVTTPDRTETSLEKVVRRIAAGVGVFRVATRDAALFSALWAFLLLPAYLLVRRRYVS